MQIKISIPAFAAILLIVFFATLYMALITLKPGFYSAPTSCR